MGMQDATLSKAFIVPNEFGLHARPAAILAKTAGRFGSEIRVQKGEEIVNGKSLIELLMLAAEKGQRLTVHAKGDDAAGLIAAVEELFREWAKEQDT